MRSRRPATGLTSTPGRAWWRRGSTSGSRRGDPTDVTARRLQNWLYAWQGFDRLPGVHRARPRAAGHAARQHAGPVGPRHERPDPRAQPPDARALRAAGRRARPARPRPGRQLAARWAALQDNLLTDVWSDGVHRERSTHYHLIALRSFVAARENVSRFGGRCPPAYDERLARAPAEFAMHLHRPDGRSRRSPTATRAATWTCSGSPAGLLERPDLLYAATRGARGAARRRALRRASRSGGYLRAAQRLGRRAERRSATSAS